MCTFCPSSVITLFIVVCNILYLLFPFICFLLIFPCLLQNLLSCSFLFYFCRYLFLVFWPIHIPFHLVIYFFLVFQAVLHFPLSSICFSLSSLHYIFFLIFHLLIICPLILLVCPSVSFFLYTSFKCILCVLLLRDRSVLMSIRCQSKPQAVIFSTAEVTYFLVKASGYRITTVKASSITGKPTERHTFRARFKPSIKEFGLLHLNSRFINYSSIQAVCWWQEMLFCVTVFITIVSFCYGNRNPGPLHANPQTFTVHTFMCGHACYFNSNVITMYCSLGGLKISFLPA